MCRGGGHPTRGESVDQTGRTRGRSVSATAVTLLLCVSSSGCFGGGSNLSEDDFNAGVCRKAAEPIIMIDTAVQQLQDEDKKPNEVVDTLKQSQSQLRKARDEADETLKQQLTALTDAIGVFRIGIDTGTVGPDQTKVIAKALKPVVATCTTQ